MSRLFEQIDTKYHQLNKLLEKANSKLPEGFFLLHQASDGLVMCDEEGNNIKIYDQQDLDFVMSNPPKSKFDEFCKNRAI